MRGDVTNPDIDNSSAGNLDYLLKGAPVSLVENEKYELCELTLGVRCMNQDRELFKLQVAAQHYESGLQMHVGYLDAFVLAVLILGIGASLAGQFPWIAAVSTWVASLVVTGFLLHSHYKRYGRRMEKLEGHLKKLEQGQPAPALKELLGE